MVTLSMAIQGEVTSQLKGCNLDAVCTLLSQCSLLHLTLFLPHTKSHCMAEKEASGSTAGDQHLFLGLDLSTQQLKIVATRADLSVHSKYSVELDSLDSTLTKGVHKTAQGSVTTPVSVFLTALEGLLESMAAASFPFHAVVGICGSCQQHGTVYYREEATELLSNMKSGWAAHMAPAFSFGEASNWQDRSTSRELDAFNRALGSPQTLCHVTGSQAHYRFSGLQIRKRAVEGSEMWQKTRHVSLISGFLNSVLTGKLAGVEASEACGTNLYNLQKGDWDDKLLALAAGANEHTDGASPEQAHAAAREMRAMLGDITPPTNWLPISTHLAKRFGFPTDCKVWPITGDNMATIMALPLRKDDLLVSMGTSTTVLLVTDRYRPSVNYHLFRHPVCPGLYMAMLCYSNGALARELVRDALGAGKGWEKFNEMLETRETSAVGVFFPMGEIIPNVGPITALRGFENGKLVEILSDAEGQVPMIIESQALSCRTRISPLLTQDETVESNGHVLSALSALTNMLGDTVAIDGAQYSVRDFCARPRKVYYAGGTSANKAIVHKFNEILGPLEGGYRVRMSDACALGGAYRAIWGETGMGESFDEWLHANYNFAQNLDEAAAANTTAWEKYFMKLGMLNLLEKEITRTDSNTGQL